MNDKTGQLLEKLAQKMGTTVQYLWGILLKQAPISATVTLFQMALVAVAGYVLYKLHIKFSKLIPEDNWGHKTTYSQNDFVGIGMVIFAIIWSISAVICICCIENVINGYFNPEYWALTQILNSAKTN